ncbi:MAG: hypothetical protein QXG00_05895 [Candidatus Woesearchaeota archaeon]
MKKKEWKKPICEKVKLRQAEACGFGIGHCKLIHHHRRHHHSYSNCFNFLHPRSFS